MLNKLIRTFGGYWLNARIRAMAEGKYGPRVKAIYWWTEGKKVLIGFVLSLLTAGLFAAGQPASATFISGTLATVFVGAGLADKKWRSSVPLEISEIELYQFLQSHSADITAGSAAVTAALAKCEPTLASLLAHVHLDCVHAASLFAGVTAALGAAGLMASAALAKPPEPAGD